MASDIDRVGAFRGVVTESGVGSTRNGFPQFTVRVQAAKKWVDSADEMKAFEIAEPAWVDWSAYDQETLGYLVLFGNDKKIEGALKETFQLEQVKNALGWDGASFQELGTKDWNGKEITFWMEENEYEGNVSIKLSTIDAADAPPVRQLKKLDATGLKDLDSRFAKLMTKKTAAAPAKAPAKGPATPPGGATPPGKPAAEKPPTGAPSAGKPAVTAAPAAGTPAGKPTATPAVKAPPTKGPPKKADAAPAAGTETMETAWNRVSNSRGKATDDQMAEAWLAAAQEVNPNKDDASTEADAEWVQIANKTIEALKAIA